MNGAEFTPKQTIAAIIFVIACFCAVGYIQYQEEQAILNHSEIKHAR